MREINGFILYVCVQKLCKLINIKNFLPKNAETPMDQEVNIPDEQQPSQPTVHRKKRMTLQLNLDDYEKRRSARSVSLLKNH